MRKEKRGELLTRMKKNKAYYLMLLPFALLFFCFILLPILASVVLSFTNFNMVQKPQFVGFDNYVRMFFDDSVFTISLKNTIVFALFTGPLSYVLCLLFAWLVNEFRPAMRSIFTFLLYVPSMSTAVYTVWAFIFSGDQYGFLNSFLMSWGLMKEPIQWLTDTRYIMGAIIVVQLWMSLGTSFLSFIAGFQGIDQGQYEAAAIDGISNRLQELIYITLPNMGPQLLFGAVMQIGASFAAGTVGQQLLVAAGAAVGGISTENAASTLVTHMNDMASVRNEMGYACAIAVLLFLMMLTFNGVVQKVLKKYSS